MKKLLLIIMLFTSILFVAGCNDNGYKTEIIETQIPNFAEFYDWVENYDTGYSVGNGLISNTIINKDIKYEVGQKIYVYKAPTSYFKHISFNDDNSIKNVKPLSIVEVVSVKDVSTYRYYTVSCTQHFLDAYVEYLDNITTIEHRISATTEMYEGAKTNFPKVNFKVQ